MSHTKVFTNGTIVTSKAVFSGTVVTEGETIHEVDASVSRAQLFSGQHIDLEGDYLLPGLVELHTDNLEKHLMPRPGVLWPSPISAIASHDAQLIGAGITTVLDSVSCGELMTGKRRTDLVLPTFNALEQARRAGILKADHMLHLRCEVSDQNMLCFVEPALESALLLPLVKLMSLMDHTPGQRQFADMSKFRQYYQSVGNWRNDEEFAASIPGLLEKQKKVSEKQKAKVVALARSRSIPLASHDDTTAAHVEEAHSQGARICEFPTTAESAGAAKRLGLQTILGAPNIVRGGSHSGNASAIDLARMGCADMLSSDYVPASLLCGAFRLNQEGISNLPASLNMISRSPALAVGLRDRGSIDPGLRADLLRVRVVNGVPFVREVWVAGAKVA